MPDPTPTRFPRRSTLALSAVIALTAGGGVAAAQSVIVTHAPPGAPVELIFNTTRVQTETADANGEATLTFALPPGQDEADVRLSTEHCGDTRRVLLVERGLQPPPVADACDRRDLPDVFAVRRVTNFVVDVQEAAPSVHIRQGPVPPFWLGHEGESETGSRLPPPPKGVIVFGGVGGVLPSNFSSVVCGTATTCSSADLKGGIDVGVGYWLKPVLGIQAGYLRSSNPTATGSGDGYSFTSSRQTEVATVTAMVGGSVGGIRIYGRGGGNYHRATLSTTETIDISGTQSLELKTAGWGWVAAGGVEIWLKPFVGIYVDGGVDKLMGNAVGGAEGSMSEQLVFANVGLRLHIGR